MVFILFDLDFTTYAFIVETKSLFVDFVQRAFFFFYVTPGLYLLLTMTYRTKFQYDSPISCVEKFYNYAEKI